MSEDVEKRTKIFLNESKELFNQLESDISNLGGRIYSFFTILLALLSFQVYLLARLQDSGRQFSNFSFFLFFFFAVIIFVCILSLICYFFLQKHNYEYIELFEKDRFNLLSSCSSVELLSDFLYHTKKCYEHNSKVYHKNITHLRTVYWLFAIGNIGYILLVISILIN